MTLKIYDFNGHVDVKISYETNYQCKTNIENTLEISLQVIYKPKSVLVRDLPNPWFPTLGTIDMLGPIIHCLFVHACALQDIDSILGL